MKTDILHLTDQSEHYPKRFQNYSHMPTDLYWSGNLPREDLPTVAIVGARMCSSYGRIQAFEFAKVFSNAGVQVISGLAYGIDAEAHKGALEGKTPTFAVLGCGPETCYPSANKALYHRILHQNGGIISEYPPGTPALPHHFPIRNRIISALADVVLVIEAKDKSGSLITANYAMEQGKSVYALPGSINDSLSIGCHRLIYDGAGIAYCPEVILEELGINVSGIFGEKEKMRKKHCFQDKNQEEVYNCLSLQPKNIETLTEETGLGYGDLCNALLQLELQGMIRETGLHNYIRCEMTSTSKRV
ncbi:MAG: DNA-processing protein DprA [Eubacteriales bacterium]|nr:DNA-processing protein DprA [Eubacteriales bacterium]